METNKKQAYTLDFDALGGIIIVQDIQGAKIEFRLPTPQGGILVDANEMGVYVICTSLSGRFVSLQKEKYFEKEVQIRVTGVLNSTIKEQLENLVVQKNMEVFFRKLGFSMKAQDCSCIVLTEKANGMTPVE